MSGLINRDEVSRAILDEFDGDIRYTMTMDEFISNVLRVVDSVKAADEIEIANAYYAIPDGEKPVEVVRCKDCTYFSPEVDRESNAYCFLHAENVDPDDFCSSADREDDEDEVDE